MPTSGTHITIVQRLALDPSLTALLGDPRADKSTPQGRKVMFDNLGAVGPDILYSQVEIPA